MCLRERGGGGGGGGAERERERGGGGIAVFEGVVQTLCPPEKESRKASTFPQC